jgi:hypothetical protein
MLDAQAGRSPARQRLVESADLPLKEVLEALASAEHAPGWSTAGVLGGSGYTLCVGEPAELDHLTTECQAILKACALTIKTEGDAQAHLEARRPDSSVTWFLAASGMWSEDMYHSGHIAYYIANPQPGCWVMEACERNAILDNVTEEDVEEGHLNDDQIQAMWGQTLEEAQNEEYRHIVAWAEGVDPDCNAVEMAAVLYRAVCESGGKEITEPDACESLLEV